MMRTSSLAGIRNRRSIFIELVFSCTVAEANLFLGLIGGHVPDHMQTHCRALKIIEAVVQVIQMNPQLVSPTGSTQ